MAAFQQRSNGYWQARVRRDGWPTQSNTFRTKVLAEQWARAVEGHMDKGSFVATTLAERTVFKDVANKFRKEYAPHHYRGDGWSHKLDRLVERLGEFSIANLNQNLVTQYRDLRLSDPDPRYGDPQKAPRVSGATVKTELDLLSKVLSITTKEFGIPLPLGNPVHTIRKPTDAPSRERRLTSEQFDSLIAQCKISRNRWLLPAVLFSTETAIRQGELLSLTWADVNIAKRVAKLPKTKNGESRTVPLSSRAAAVLEGLARTIKGKVFPVGKQTLYGAYKAACERAKIKDFTWHDLRHEALSRLAERGDLSVLELSAISGHKTLRLMQLYVQMHASDLAKKLG
jgi:integrase